MHSLSFQCPEQIQGALWFVPVWLVSAGLFGGCIWFGRTTSRKIGKPKGKLWFAAAAVFVLGSIGYFLNMRKCSLPYKLQAALLVVPIYFFAWLIRQYLPSLKRWLPWYGCILSAILLHLCNSRLHIFVDLDSMSVPGLWFYAVSALGIYFVLSLARLAEALTPAAKLLAFLGRQSFDIMAVHFLVFKLLDYGYASLVLKELPDTLSSFPVSFRYELGPLYIAAGLLIPAGIGWLTDRAFIHYS